MHPYAELQFEVDHVTNRSQREFQGQVCLLSAPLRYKILWPSTSTIHIQKFLDPKDRVQQIVGEIG